MNRTLHNAARWSLLGLAVAVVVAAFVALACGPAQDGGDGVAPTPTFYIIDGSSPSKIATAMARPTATPYPPGYVPPTDLPTFTPMPSLPTLKARMEQESAALRTEEAKAGAGGAAGNEDSGENAGLRSVAKQVALGEYDAIARIRVVSERDVRVPDNGLDPSSKKVDVTRHTVDLVTAYRGTLPTQFDIVSYSFLPGAALDIKGEYVLALYKFWIPESEYSEREPWRGPFTPEALEAAGGEAYAYNIRLVWVVDGKTAYRVPRSHTWSAAPDYGSHLEAARNGDIKLPLPTLEAALRP